MQLSRFSILTILALTGCEASDEVTLKSQIIVEQAASMESVLPNSADVYEKIWNESFETNFSSLPLSGTAARIPRSGHWYPEQSGGLNSTDVLRKYDQAYGTTGGSAYDWEIQNRTSRISWAGHCNGFAAAAIRHAEPRRSVYKNGILFSRQDIKALLAGVYMSAGFKFLGGTRCERSLRNYNPTSNLDSCQDINPGLFHTVIANWIGRKKQSIIFDRNGDNQVWNYPLYGYQSYSQEISASKAMRLTGGGGSNYTPNRDAAKFLEVTTNITYADAVNGYEVLDYNQEGRMSYSYVLELSGDGTIIGGAWASKSQTEHPDFLWIPLEPKRGSGTKDGGNPHLDPQEILQIWAESRGLTSPSQEPPPYDLFSWDTNWGDFSFYKASLDGVSNGVSFSNLSSKMEIESNSSLIVSGDDQLQVFVDDKLIASPKLDVSSNPSFLVPVETGITRMTLRWNTQTYNNSNEPHNVFYYTMD